MNLGARHSCGASTSKGGTGVLRSSSLVLEVRPNRQAVRKGDFPPARVRRPVGAPVARET
jgi:hypothetical protein